MVIGGALGLAALVTTIEGSFITRQNEQTVVTELGEPKKVILGSREPGKPDQKAIEKIQKYCKDNGYKVELDTKPGLKFIIPFLQHAQTFPLYNLMYESNEHQLNPKDNKTVTMQHYSRWVIENPLLFRQKVGTIKAAAPYLDDQIFSRVSNTASQYNLVELIRTSNRVLETSRSSDVESITVGRDSIMTRIKEVAKKDVEQYGMALLDVRFKQVSLPKENLPAMYARMQSDRQKISNGYDAQGEMEGKMIRSQAEMDALNIRSEGNRLAQGYRGLGDAQAIQILAQAANKDPEFFAFVKRNEQNIAAAKDAEAKGRPLKLVVNTSGDFYSIFGDQKK